MASPVEAPALEIRTAINCGQPPASEERQAEGGVIHLLVVHDHKIVRKGFIHVLAREQELEVVGEAADGEEAVREAEALRPDVIIMDVEMPTMDGIEAIRQIRQRWPEIRVIGLSIHEETAIVRAMTEAGAAAYLNKQAPAEDLVATVRYCCGCE